jgi:hypothetical protein
MRKADVVNLAVGIGLLLFALFGMLAISRDISAANIAGQLGFF